MLLKNIILLKVILIEMLMKLPSIDPSTLFMINYKEMFLSGHFVLEIKH